MQVQIQSGALRGEERNGVRIFLGIPYAAPPLGELRFAAPRAPAAWSGVHDATHFAHKAPQFDRINQRMIGDEDCLVVNVYAPPTAGPHPVLVWIHGGGAVIGSPNDYDGTLFAQHGVVVVTVGYRLGMLGLLHLPGVFEPDVACNFSLLDQVAALRWVQENIAAFGGDPAQVTVAGESNGGRTVGALLATPSAHNLFQQAIIQSGTGVGYIVATPEEASKTTEALLTELGLDWSNAQQLRALPVAQLMEAQLRFSATSAVRLPYQVVVDGKTLVQRPIDALTAGAARGVRVLIGTNHDEEDFFALTAPGPATPDSMVVSAQQLGPALRAYRQLLPADWSDDEVVHHVRTCSEWWLPAIRCAEAQIKASSQVWMYRLDWRFAPRGQGMGAFHSLDVPLYFGLNNVQGFQIALGRLSGPRVSAIAEAMHAAWVQFIATGEPGWPAYDLSNRATFLFNDTSTLVQDPDRALRVVWNDFA